jgi:hypothetical protein
MGPGCSIQSLNSGKGADYIQASWKFHDFIIVSELLPEAVLSRMTPALAFVRAESQTFGGLCEAKTNIEVFDRRYGTVRNRIRLLICEGSTAGF